MLDELASAIQARKGLMVLTGEVGTGKTTLINVLRQWLQKQQTPTAFIFNSHLEVNELFDLMLADFGIFAGTHPNGSALGRLNQWLIQQYGVGRNAVVILDEAQGLSQDVLKEICMLLNHEMAQDKLLQIVLSGQPELDEKLKKPELRQIRQYISLRCHTMALTGGEAHGYIQKRLELAGGTVRNVFPPEAVEAIYLYSHGIPRVMNLLCEHAMIQAYLAQTRPVPARVVDDVAKQLQFDDVRPIAGRRHLETGLIPESPLAAPVVRSQRTLPSAVVEAAIPPEIALDSIVTVSALSTLSLKPPQPRADTKTEPIRVLEFRTQDSSTEKPQAGSIAEPSKISVVSQRTNSKQGVTVATAVDNVWKSIVDFSRFRRLGLQRAEWGSKLLVLSRLLSQQLSAERRTRLMVRLHTLPLAFSAGWRKASELPKSVEWQQNLDSLVRWLRQPLPAVKLHRKAGH